MRSTRRAWLAAIAASGSLAGCIGDGGDDGSDGDGSDGGGDSGDGGMDGGAATVQVAEHDQYGEILVDADGMVLYMFDSDTQGDGASTCSGGCASTWPPLTVEDGAMAGASVEAELTTFERGDGDTQVAANGWPLYYYASDSEAGDASGQGVQDVWWVLGPDGSPMREGSGNSSDSSNGGDGVGDTTY